MSLVSKIKTILLGGALLLSGITGGVYAQDTIPGGVGHKGYEESSKHKEEKKPAPSTPAPSPKPAPKPTPTPSRSPGFSTPSSWDDDDEDEYYEEADQESIDKKVASFSLFDSYRVGRINLDFDADMTDLSCNLNADYHKLFTGNNNLRVTPIFNAEFGYYSRHAQFMKQSVETDYEYARAGLSLYGKMMINTMNSKLTNGRKTPEGFFIGPDAKLHLLSQAGPSEIYDNVDMGISGGLCCFLNLKGYQWLTSLRYFYKTEGLRGEQVADDFSHQEYTGCVFSTGLFIPLEIDKRNLFIRPRLEYKYYGIHTAVLREYYYYGTKYETHNLNGIGQELDLLLSGAIVFNANGQVLRNEDKSGMYLAIGPEVRITYLSVQRDTSSLERGLPKYELGVQAGAGFTFVFSKNFRGSLRGGYSKKDLDFFGADKKITTDGLYIDICLSIDL